MKDWFQEKVEEKDVFYNDIQTQAKTVKGEEKKLKDKEREKGRRTNSKDVSATKVRKCKWER